MVRELQHWGLLLMAADGVNSDNKQQVQRETLAGSSRRMGREGLQEEKQEVAAVGVKAGDTSSGSQSRRRQQQEQRRKAPAAGAKAEGASSRSKSRKWQEQEQK